MAGLDFDGIETSGSITREMVIDAKAEQVERSFLFSCLYLFVKTSCFSSWKCRLGSHTSGAKWPTHVFKQQEKQLMGPQLYSLAAGDE
jgi:hypothetical protein